MKTIQEGGWTMVDVYSQCFRGWHNQVFSLYTIIDRITDRMLFCDTGTTKKKTIPLFILPVLLFFGSQSREACPTGSYCKCNFFRCTIQNLLTAFEWLCHSITVGSVLPQQPAKKGQFNKFNWVEWRANNSPSLYQRATLCFSNGRFQWIKKQCPIAAIYHSSFLLWLLFMISLCMYKSVYIY